MNILDLVATRPSFLHMETDKNARRGMMIYALAIFIIAVVLAIGYGLVVHPGEPRPITRSLDGNIVQ